MRFKVTVSDVDNYLGMQIKVNDNGAIEISQTAKVVCLLERYGMSDANPLQLPIEPGWWPGDSPLLEDKTSYHEVICSLLNLVQWTRPDIAFAVNVTSRAQAHQQLMKCIMRYLKGTRDDCIHFEMHETDNIDAYSDADHADDKVTRRLSSGSGIVFAGGAVLWKSKLQRCVALSSMEAEYIAASETAKLIEWMDRLLKELFMINNETMPMLNMDKKSAIKLIGNPEFHERSEHIETCYHFVRQLVSEKKIDIQYITTEDQVADVFTKGLPAKKLATMKKKLGIRTFSDEPSRVSLAETN